MAKSKKYFDLRDEVFTLTEVFCNKVYDRFIENTVEKNAEFEAKKAIIDFIEFKEKLIEKYENSILERDVYVNHPTDVFMAVVSDIRTKYGF